MTKKKKKYEVEKANKRGIFQNSKISNEQKESKILL
jgi:hypothetical protein